jgi:hypothetical protein
MITERGSLLLPPAERQQRRDSGMRAAIKQLHIQQFLQRT